MPGSPTENSTIVRFYVLSALAVAMSACAAATPVSHERGACGPRERLVCESSAGARRCVCAADAELERIFGRFGARLD